MLELSQFPKKEICHHQETIVQFLFSHTNAIFLEARRLIGILYNKLYCYTDTPILLKLYLTTVQPNLEYGSSVWDPLP